MNINISIYSPKKFRTMKRKIKVIINGLEGKMAYEVIKAAMESDDIEVLPYSLTGPETKIANIIINDINFKLFKPSERNFLLTNEWPDIIVDYTAASAIEENVDFYTSSKIPFVLGTTGGDLQYISDKVQAAAINAVVAPNMAKDVVLIQAMFDFAAKNFPGALTGFFGTTIESHQQKKTGTSGTATAIVTDLITLGVECSIDEIIKKRTEADYEHLGIPQEHWGAHGWHTFSLAKKDDKVLLEFTLHVNGRQPYLDGTLEAIRFLSMVEENILSFGRVYSMIDILKNEFKAYAKK